MCRYRSDSLHLLRIPYISHIILIIKDPIIMMAAPPVLPGHGSSINLVGCRLGIGRGARAV